MVDGVSLATNLRPFMLTRKVYTCQKPQPKRCHFFLWDDSAKQREKSVVLNNSRSELGGDSALPSTPSRKVQQKIEMTPRTCNVDDSPTRTRIGTGSSSKTLDHEDSFGWPTSDDDVFADISLERNFRASSPSPQTSRKAAKTVQFSSPGKRRHSEMESSSSPTSSEEAFETPKTSMKRPGGLMSPDITPAADRTTPAPEQKDLVAGVRDLLGSVTLQPEIEKQLMDFLNRHELRTHGISKGREISRLAIKEKDKQIAELQARITGLEAEKETSKLVIATLKRDMSTPKKKKG